MAKSMLEQELDDFQFDYDRLCAEDEEMERIAEEKAMELEADFDECAKEANPQKKLLSGSSMSEAIFDTIATIKDENLFDYINDALIKALLEKRKEKNEYAIKAINLIKDHYVWVNT